ncbi:MAG: TadE family protein [Microbacterium sp. SCN 70-200]|nr:TadE family protein [Microbacterium sp.]ODT40731.1 MAG: TadE family protein [Microbacterium sp. SCN 70-200]OJV83728.1 MAG: TadE family protein [Microbacterium sp. 70-16]
MRRARGSTEQPAGTMPADDDGSASLEFIGVGVILLVPIVYLIVALGAIQGQALGVETGARQIARTIAEAPDAAEADARAARVRDAIIAEYDLDPAAVEVAISCEGATTCPEAGAVLSVTMTTAVPLPLVPAVFGLENAARVPVQASAVQKVSRFWGTAP